MNPVTLLAAPMAVVLVITEAQVPTLAFGYHAAVAIIFGTVAFIVGAVAVAQPRPLPPITLQIKPGRHRRYLGVGILAGSLALLAVAYFAGRSFSSNSTGVVRAGLFDRSLVQAEIAGTGTGLMLRLVVLASFVVVGFITLAALARARWWKLSSVFCALSVAALAIGTRARLSAVLAALLALIIVKTARRPGTPTWRRDRRTFALAAVLVIGGLWTVFTAVSQGRYSRAVAIDQLLYSIASGPSGLQVALSGEQWVEFPAGAGVTVAGPLELLGIRHRELLTATTVRPDPTAQTTVTNIYTGFYLLIRDLGMPLACGVLIGLGAATSLVHRRFCRRPTPAGLVLVGQFGVLLASFSNTAISTYNSWWLLLIVVAASNRVFDVHSAAAPSRPSQEAPRRAARSLSAASNPDA